MKNPQQNGTITVVGSGPNGGSGPPDPKFMVGDRVRLYLYEEDGMYMISMYSTNANPKCYAHELLGLGPREPIPRGGYDPNLSEINCGPPFANLFYPDIVSKFLPPTIQFQSGIQASSIACNEGFQLVIKSSNGHPVCVKSESIAKLVSRDIIKGEVQHEKSVSKDVTNNTQYIPPEVKDKILNVYGLSIKFISSDKGFFTGGVAPVGKDGSTAKTVSHGLLYSTKKDVTVHKLFLCKSDDCIDSDGSMTFAYASMPGPGFLYFYDLNKVSWKEGDKVHIWAKVSEGIYDSSKQDLPKTNWIDIGITTIEPCETYGFWCYPK